MGTDLGIALPHPLLPLLSSRRPSPRAPRVQAADLARSQGSLEGTVHVGVGTLRRRRWNTPPDSVAPSRSPRFSHRRSTGLKSIPRELPEVEDVCAFLETIGLGQHSAAFRKNRVDGIALLRMGDDHLKRLGVHAMAHRQLLRESQRKWYHHLQARHPQGGTTASPKRCSTAAAAASLDRVSHRGQPLARLRDKRLEALSAVPFAKWSVQHVLKWVSLIQLPDEVVGPVHAAVTAERLDGYEIQTMSEAVLRAILKASNVPDIAAVLQHLIECRDEKLAAERVLVARQGQTKELGPAVPKSWLRRWDSHLTGWNYLIERVEADQNGPSPPLLLPKESLVLTPGGVKFREDTELSRRRSEAKERYGAIQRGEHLEEERYRHAIHTAEMMCRAFRAASYVRGNSNIQALFQLHDTDHDGMMSAGEFLRAVRTDGKISARQFSHTDVLRLFAFLDEDGDGLISCTEFVSFITSCT